MWFYEDAPIGITAELGTATVSAEEIVRFGRTYDPQPFHVDEAAARTSLYGGLIASGWQTAGLFMRTFVAYNERLSAAMAARGEPVAKVGASPGFEALTWPRPVRPGDRLTFFSTPADKRPLASRPGWGLVMFDNAGVNQNGEPVLRFRSKVFIERRER